MKRRDFLKSSVAGGAAIGLAGTMGSLPREAHGQTLARAIVDIMLLGGADLRHVLAPPPNGVYADAFWAARQDIYRYNAAEQAMYPGYPDVWDGLYLPVQWGEKTFGIHKSAAWLKDQFEAGNVAIIANVLGSENRRHDHSQRIMWTGDPATGQFDVDRDGWGGRLVYEIGAANTVVVSSNVPLFAQGEDPTDRDAQVVHVKDSRNFGLSRGNETATSAQSIMGRALHGYYEAKQQEVRAKPAEWVYRRFFNHERNVRAFGDQLQARLSAVAPDQPASLKALYTPASGSTLSNPGFGKQCASLYDSILAADLFQLRAAYMDYGGWDSHKDERTLIEGKVADILGTGGGLDVLTQALEPIGANQDLVYVITTDFGRQLKANGAYGTDHGSGNSMLLIGSAVNGGVYGEMFPESEIPRYAESGADIKGETDFRLVLAAACDWVGPGTGASVFPNTQGTLPIEAGVDLGTLFSG